MPFKNTLNFEAKHPNIKGWCYFCYGGTFKGSATYYLKNKESGHSMPSSEWGNLRKRFYGRGEGVEQKLIDWLFEKAGKQNPENRVKLSDAYYIICTQPMVPTGSDFHIVLGGGIYLMYTCAFCKTAPVNPRYWLRCTDMAHRLSPGGTTEHGKWHCGAKGCLQRWTWSGGGSKRLLLLPDEAHGFDSLKQVVIGNTTTQQEHTITLLKSAQLLLEAVDWDADGRHVTLGKEAIIAAIEILNKKAEGRILATNLPRTLVTSADRDDINLRGLYPYCENPALSLSEPGLVYKALHVPDGTPVIKDDDRQELLDMLTCFYDFSQCRPANSGELMQAWRRAHDVQSEMRRIYWPADE